MATRDVPEVPFGAAQPLSDAALQRPWRMVTHLSSFVASANGFLERASFDRGPWLVVAFACGIAAWFALDGPWQWVSAICGTFLIALASFSVWREGNEKAALRDAVVGVSTALALGIGVIWARSATVGVEPIEYPRVERFEARILEREAQPADERVRLTVAMRDAEKGMARKVRLNVPLKSDSAQFAEGAIVRIRVRLMPPAPPMLPGGYDFARAAWFQSLSATGSVLGDVELVAPAEEREVLASTQRFLSGHVRSRLEGSPAAIAAAFASGDRGAISEADEVAMRDAGLTHLLSISGVHVSAVIASAYFIALRLLALWPRLALRMRLPVVAAGVGALAGLGYTLLTGSEVPTVRSCVGAMLVLVALAIGREPLSMRMLAVAAGFVLFAWPESLVGPSFQMSFAAVMAIIALHGSGWVKSFLAPREESFLARFGRRGVILLLTGLVIELALMPIVLFHFHRAGIYGALANVVGIPLVTFVTMPMIAIGLLFDLVGLGAPAWWLVQQSIELLMGIAHFTASRPGAVRLMPQMDGLTLMLFVGGGLWLAMWQGRARLYGLVPVLIAAISLMLTATPDVLISGDGRHVGIAGEGKRLLTLRDSRSNYAKDNLLEHAGVAGEPIALANWPGAKCSPDFCTLVIERGGRAWTLLMARNKIRIEERALAAACERTDIVVADRWLPRSCSPKWLKADRKLLSETGGLSLYLQEPEFRTVAESQGQHGWWRGGRD